MSPNYPEDYPQNSFCPTRITAPADYRVLLVFLDVALETDSSPGCRGNFDTIKIYDDYKEEPENLIGTLCGENPEQTVYTSSGDSMYALFTSDGNVNQRGFNAIFYTYPGNVIHFLC